MKIKQNTEKTIFDAKTFNNGQGVEVGEFIRALEKTLKESTLSSEF